MKKRLQNLTSFLLLTSLFLAACGEGGRVGARVEGGVMQSEDKTAKLEGILFTTCFPVVLDHACDPSEPSMIDLTDVNDFHFEVDVQNTEGEVTTIRTDPIRVESGYLFPLPGLQIITLFPSRATGLYDPLQEMYSISTGHKLCPDKEWLLTGEWTMIEGSYFYHLSQEVATYYCGAGI